MDRGVEARIYPNKRSGLTSRDLQFCRSLISLLVRPQNWNQLRMRLLFSSPDFVRRIMWAYYITPSRRYKPVALSASSQRHLEALKADGIVRFDRNFAALADHVRQRYLSPESALPADAPLRRNGLEISHSVSFSDEVLHEVFFDSEICAIICNYYCRQAYYRDNPTVHQERFTSDSMPLVSGVFHSDGYRQVSFMLLLSNLTLSDTHMEYAMGSHREQQPSYDRAEIDQATVPREFKIAHVVGRKGTLFIFDTEGLHRGAHQRNGLRQILHVNVTTGTIPFTDQKYDSSASIFPNVARVSPHVRGFIAGAVKRV